MIEANNISKSFKGKQILTDVSAKFLPGKVNMIIGSSGTGKSVFLKNIVGLVEPDEGNVCFDGRNFTTSNRKDKNVIRREIGMLFQGSALFDSKTVEENVRFPLDMLTTMSPQEKLDRVNFCLERVGLEGANTKMPSELSGGMQKRVGIARAIVNNSKYLFCDEPNSGLDPQTSILIDDLIMEITKEFNITTIVVSHDMNSVMKIGEHIIFLFKGKKLWEGTNDQIIDTDCKELQDFIFANNLMKALKEMKS
ncbi:ABC transporter ATP-binding protein [Aureibacter tunicatorum]|uniref:Phospholipid/cholesterol/gamma-HCH transport system ATP-binding protein n=1 Tax=Aureibacter tunicatorum TaxID=866807 RepID=A0AAE4BSN5_9BACT|nr:ATP-binding cassette domain-containing protein [Aureibacter tunicatorum]MDR6239008.1 phospholipid/cholesterol/gamma-HCH transport system ATP-binding protein [Aureibacter tunicatorum]BDD05066.1 phosphonate ABC transporter ATP-binding protein [Aureibacter tunicatorum]